MGEYIEPFDFQKILVEYFLGNQGLFAFALILILSAVCGYYQMSNRIFGLVLVLSSAILAVYLGEAIFFVTLVLFGFIVFKGISNL